MGFTRAAYNPTDGIKNVSSYPTNPTDETAARKQLQDNFDQIKNAVNVLEGELEASGGASKIGALVGGVLSNLQAFIDIVEAAGIGSLPPANSVTNTILSSDVKVGSLAALTTSVKTSIQAAINSIVTLIGSLAGLSTTDKTSIVNSINEVNGKTASPLTTEGDMLYRNSTAPTRLAKGAAKQQLLMNSGATAPEWVNSVYNILSTTGDLLYASGANTPARLAVGASGKVLTSDGSTLAWGYSPPTKYEASDVVVVSATTERTLSGAGSSSYTTKKTFTSAKQGTARIKMQVKSSDSLNAMLIKVTNSSDAQLGIESTASTTYVTKTIDVTIPADGIIHIKLAAVSGVTAYIKDAQMCANSIELTSTATLD